METVLLYNSAVSGNCYKVRLLLAQLGLPYERRELSVIDRSDRPEVLSDLNPSLRVPTLVLADGRPLGESGAILTFLADGTPFLPTDPYERATVLQWMFFEQYEIEPNIAVARFLLHIAGQVPGEERLAALQEGGGRALAALDRRLSGHAFLAAGRYTIADIAAFGYVHVADEGGAFDLSAYPAVGRWIERVRQQPGHVTIDA